jgi:hypothetical protein
MNIELKGSVKVIYVEKQITDNFSKKEFVITVDEDTSYPQDIIIQATNNNIDKLKEVQVGNKVIVKCNLKGNVTKEGKHFNQLNLWEIENKTNR